MARLFVPWVPACGSAARMAGFGCWPSMRTVSGYASLPAGQDRLQFSTHTGAVAVRAPRKPGHADVAQLVEHHLAKVRVAGSNPVVRSEVPEAVSRADGPLGSSVPARLPVGRPVAEWPSGLGKGLQSPVRGFDSRFRLGGG
jgi:hypothetical protein